MLEQLRRRLIGEPTNAPGGAQDAEDDPTTSAGKKKVKAPTAREKSALERFTTAMQAAVQKARELPRKQVAAVMWLEVMLHMLVRQLRQRAEAAEFLVEWFSLACELGRGERPLPAFEQNVLTAAATRSVMISEKGHGALRLAEIHEQLERFFGGDVPAGSRGLVLSSDAAWLFRGVVDSPSPNMSEAFQHVTSTVTRRRLLVDLLARYSSGEPVPEDHPLLRGPHEELLKKQFLERGRLRITLQAARNQEFCSSCHMMLTPAQLLDLGRDRVTVCRCNGLLLDTMP